MPIFLRLATLVAATFWPELQHENSKLLYNKDYVEQLDGTGAKDFEPDFETIIKAEEEEERLEEHLRFLDSNASDEVSKKLRGAKRRATNTIFALAFLLRC